jgi:hypothetical protein
MTSHPDLRPHTVTALAWDENTRDWTKPVTYRARTKDEARNWVAFQRDYMKGFKIISDEWLAALAEKGSN